MPEKPLEPEPEAFIIGQRRKASDGDFRTCTIWIYIKVKSDCRLHLFAFSYSFMHI